MKILYGFIIGLFIAVAITFSVYIFQVFKTIPLAEPVTVIIEENSGTEGTVGALWNAKIIPSRWSFIAHLIITGKRSDVRAGTYVFTNQVSIPDVISIITQEESFQDEVQITLLEGWTNEEMAAYLRDNSVMDYDRFLKAAETEHSQEILPEREYDFLIGKPLSVGLQGFLFPDTYRIFVGETEIGLVEKMLDNFDSKFTPQMRADLTAQNRSIYDAVILASIVEREVQSDEDKKIVAGIFWKRIDEGVRLQSDATINYITHKKTTTPNSVDLQVESAYNTYRNDGLPPTPIANPGLASLEAAVYPIETEYYYFLTTPKGEVKYSSTYEQHLDFRNQYYE